MLSIRNATGFGLALLSMLGFSAARPAVAQTSALSYTSPNTTGAFYGPYSLGFTFTTSAPILVTSLGYDKALGDPTTVHLFVDATQTELAFTDVSTSDTLVDGFYYHALTTSVLLSPGVTYLVASNQYAGIDYYPGTRTPNPTITFIENRGAYTNYAPFVYPTGNEGSNIATTNFQFTAAPIAAAPEPSQFAALAVGLLGLGALTLKARRRSAAVRA